MGGTMAKCWKSEPTYARYHSNSKENVPDLENIVGSLLEMDPSLQDREEGVAKINLWIEEISPDIQMSPEHLEISRWKCIKYWEAQHADDTYGNNSSTGIKLTGSCVRFYFERKEDGTIPRLVIEHCGRSVLVKKTPGKSIPVWLKKMKKMSSRSYNDKRLRDNSMNRYEY